MRTDDGGTAERFPRLSELVRSALLRPGPAAVLRRRVEPALMTHRLLSAGLALVGRPRRLEVALIYVLGPLARPPAPRPLATGVWIDVTPALLDHIGGPGWEWPVSDGSVWSDGAEARLVLDFDGSGGRDLVFQFLLGDEAHLSPNPSIAVLVNGRPVEGWHLGPEPEQGPRTLRVPAWLVDWCRPLEVVFRPHEAFSPRTPCRCPGRPSSHPPPARAPDRRRSGRRQWLDAKEPALEGQHVELPLRILAERGQVLDGRQRAPCRDTAALGA